MTKKDRILNIALKYFSEEGYEAVGVQKIAEGAGVTKPTLYHYYNNKEGLLTAILDEGFDGFLGKLEELCIYRGDMRTSLEGIICHYFEFVLNNKELCRLILALTFAPVKSQSYLVASEKIKKQYSIVEKVFLEGEKQHGNMKGRSIMFTYSFIGIINSAITYYFFSENSDNLGEESARELCRQFMHGIFS